jgi:hypothetical protein
MTFAFLGYHQEQNWGAMSKGQQDAMVKDCFTYDRKLLKDGHMIPDGVPLQASRIARTLRWQNGAVLVTDGPFAETKEHLGGIGVLEARDMEHAVELMSRHPGLRYGATFEIRPIDEASLERQAKSMAERRGSAPAVNSEALQFAGLGYIDEHGWDSISPEERNAMLERCRAYDEERVQCGQWLKGFGLQHMRTARTLRAKAGQVVVTDGPFAETKEYLGGIVVLAFKDWNDAVASVSRHPALPFGVTIELRPTDEATIKRWEATRA